MASLQGLKEYNIAAAAGKQDTVRKAGNSGKKKKLLTKSERASALEMAINEEPSALDLFSART